MSSAAAVSFREPSSQDFRRSEGDLESDEEEALPQFAYTVEMLDRLSQKHHLPPDAALSVESEPKAPGEGFLLPNYVVPCPLLVRLKPYLSNPQYQRPPRLGLVLKVRRTSEELALLGEADVGLGVASAGVLARPTSRSVNNVSTEAAPEEEEMRDGMEEEEEEEEEEEAEMRDGMEAAVATTKTRTNATSATATSSTATSTTTATATTTKKRKRAAAVTAASAARDADEAAYASSSKSTIAKAYLPRRVTRTDASMNRPTLKQRVRYLHPERNLTESPTRSARVYIVHDSGSKKQAERLLESLSHLEKVKVRIPKEGAVATNNPRITHIVLPYRSYHSLFVTYALANGAWRVPQDWVKATVAASNAAGRTTISEELVYQDFAFRSRYYLFKNQPFHVMLSDESEKENIVTLLRCSGANSVELDDNPKILVIDDSELPIDAPDPERYWLRSDFNNLFQHAITNAKTAPPKEKDI